MDPVIAHRPPSLPGVRRCPRTLATLLTTVLASAVAVLGFVAPAQAHASLVDSSPGPGAVLEEAPAIIELRFDEGIGVINDSVRVFDRDGSRVDLDDASVDGLVVKVSLPPDLTEGGYLVSWQVVSDDGHPIRGSFSFSVGDFEEIDPDLAAGLLATNDQTLWDLAGWFTRALGYLGALLAAGLAVFYSRALPAVPVNESARRLMPWIRMSSWIAIMAIALNALVQGVRLTGGGFDAFADPNALEVALGQGALASALVTATGLTVLVVLAGPSGADWWRPGSRSWLVVPAALVGVAGFAIAGHTATRDPRWLVTLVDAVHLGAAAVWFGGLAGLALLLGRLDDNETASSSSQTTLVARFSGLAAVSLGIVALSGLIVAGRLGSLGRALFDTGHGRVLAAKIFFVAVAAALGAWNRYRLVPTIGGAGGRLRKVVLAEVALLALVIGLTASLVIMPPGGTPSSALTGETTSPAGVSSELATLADPEGTEVSVVVTFEPGRPGQNDVVLEVTVDGQPVEDIDEVLLRLTQVDVGIGPVRVEATEEAPGRWRTAPVDIAVAGTWDLEVFVARPTGVATGTATVDL